MTYNILHPFESNNDHHHYHHHYPSLFVHTNIRIRQRGQHRQQQEQDEQQNEHHEPQHHEPQQHEQQQHHEQQWNHHEQRQWNHQRHDDDNSNRRNNSLTSYHSWKYIVATLLILYGCTSPSGIAVTSFSLYQNQHHHHNPLQKTTMKSYSTLLSYSSSTSSDTSDVITLHATYTSTLIPHPRNRNQHVEFLNQYLGSSSSSSSLLWEPQQQAEQQQATLQQQQQATLQQQRHFYPKAVSSSTLIPRRRSSSSRTIISPQVSIDTKIQVDDDGIIQPQQQLQQQLKEENTMRLRRKQQQELWAAKYTTVQALRETFGTNRNSIWGDLDAKTTRRLYKTLLPRALLELHYNNAIGGSNNNANVMMIHPEDLAPLAYQARVAAKLYARERCHLPARIIAHLYDGIRQYTKYGTFNCIGMSYQQIWEKYANTIILQHDVQDLTVDDVTAKICLKILERSCQTNTMVDNFVKYNNSEEDITDDLKFITLQLEADAKSLLQGSTFNNYYNNHDENTDMLLSDHTYTSSALLLDTIPIMEEEITESRYSSSSSSSYITSLPSSTKWKKNKGGGSVVGLRNRFTKCDNDQQQQQQQKQLLRFQKQKLRLIRSIVRMKRKFENFHKLQQNQNQQK